MMRQTRGDENINTLQDISQLGQLPMAMGDAAAALPLLEESHAGLRRVVGAEHQVTLRAAIILAGVHDDMDASARARMLYEKVVEVQRRKWPADPNTFTAIGNLGNTVNRIGDFTTALALREEAAASARRELGDAHPTTLQETRLLACTRERAQAAPSGTRAVGALIGLVSKPELNSKMAFVVGFDAATGRYRALHQKGVKPIGIKPANIILYSGSAVIVEGLQAQPEWNGKRGLVERYDEQSGRYTYLLVADREKALNVRPGCCKLEFAVTAWDNAAFSRQA